MKFCSVVLLCVVSVLGQLDHHEVLDGNGIYHLYWSVQGNNVTFQIAVRNHGYCGFGFSPNGDMTNSDVIIVWVNGSYTNFTDRFAYEHVEPAIDKINNYYLMDAYENATHTVAKFNRLIDTGDAKEDRVIEKGPIHLIYSYYPEDPVLGQPLPWHTTSNRGTKQVTILQ